ncbi:hypothetical protein [Dyella sp.]|uniref:hypothetical protein n=1 Tax=Dyella sp. TaxID=1869338 RepID=UPI002ED65FA2
MDAPDEVQVDVVFPFSTAYRATLNIIFHSWLHIFLWLLFPGMGLWLLVLWLVYHEPIGLGGAGLVLLCFLFCPLTTALALWNSRRRNSVARGPFAYRLNALGMHASGAMFEVTLKWPAIRCVRERGGFIFLYFAPLKAQCLPVVQLQAAGQLQRVRCLLAQQVADVRLREDGASPAA